MGLNERKIIVSGLGTIIMKPGSTVSCRRIRDYSIPPERMREFYVVRYVFIKGTTWCPSD
jgi:hypothetical protein